MKKLFLIVALAAVALLCCQCTTSKELRQAQKGAQDVPYTVLQNYYVRNDVNATQMQRLILDNEEDFNAFFGPAAVMGGLPTDINWKTQFVIAIVLPETQRTTNVIPKAVKQSPGNVIFEYALNRGRKTGYRQVPFSAVAVNRAAAAQELQVFFIEK